MNWIDISLALKTLQEICSDNEENCKLCPFGRDGCVFIEPPQDWDVKRIVDEVKDWRMGK